MPVLASKGHLACLLQCMKTETHFITQTSKLEDVKTVDLSKLPA
jgi:hypothetical protein